MGKGTFCVMRLISGFNNSLIDPLQDELANVGEIDCHSNGKLCKTLGVEYGTRFFPADKVEKGQGMVSEIPSTPPTAPTLATPFFLNTKPPVLQIDCHLNGKLCKTLGVEYGTRFFPADKVEKGQGMVSGIPCAPYHPYSCYHLLPEY